MRELAVAMTQSLSDALARHLLREDGQEDVCFAVYRTTTGVHRDTVVLYDIELPLDGERIVRGNVSFTTEYLRRVIARARQEGAGVAVLHSHPRGSGWQGMSSDDRDGESRHAAVVLSNLGLPLVGLTLAGENRAWSARRWTLTSSFAVNSEPARLVRVVGSRLTPTFKPSEVAKPQETQTRTVSFWGEENQAALASLTVAIVGLGSVGSIVAELLARTGIQRLILIDFDIIKTHNLDRTISAVPTDIGKPKVEVAAQRARAIATAAHFQARPVVASVVEDDGYEALLDADVVFSCVDRPWARHVINRCAYAHLIPVVDGGILVRFRKGGTEMLNADWAVHSAGPEKACLLCQHAYSLDAVSLEQTGMLENESYIQGLPDDSPLKRRENVIALSASVASFEVLQLVAMVSGLMDLADPGQQRYAYYPGNVRLERFVGCEPHCMTRSFTALGDRVMRGTGHDHSKAALQIEMRATGD